MHTHILFILSLVLLLFNTTTATSRGHQLVVAAGQAVHKCIEKERQALLDFKAPLQDPFNELSTWRPEEEDDCCQWFGVTCNTQTGHVTALDFYSYGLGGEISLSLLNLTYLTHLTYLNLGENKFSGSIPKSIGNMTQLTYLNLRVNQFSGTIPETIRSLTKLTSLQLSDNSFYGTFPKFICSMNHLTSLSLAFNKFTGTIPESIGNMTQLTFLDLSGSNFNGTIPISIGSLTSLTDLFLSENEFSGVIPESIGSLAKLTDLDLHWNKFSGTIPMSIGYLTKLTSLDLAVNNFSGVIPRSIGSLTKLKSLDLSDNSFYGTIPREFGNLTNLTDLYLDSLRSCRVENIDWLSSLSSLKYLFMDGTSLAKANNWVNAIIGLQNLFRLSLVGCDLSHVMHPYSSSINSSSSIHYLFLDNNNLSSSMYSWLFPLFGKKLEDLAISGNTFDGNLSDFLNTLSTSASSLERLNASSNQFTGSLSDEIQNFSFLRKLEYHLEEVYKATTDQLDWVNPEGQQYPHNLLQPLPLIPYNRGRSVIPFEHFINNDLEYLRGGASSRKYTTSITKTKVADYGHIKWIDDLVPRTMWIEEPIGYDKHALWGVSHWGCKRQPFYGFAVNQESARDVYSKRRIIAVTKLKIVERHNYKHLDWITVRIDDDKLYKFKEGDLKRLRIQDIKDMLLLLIQGKLTNLTVEERFAFNVSLRMFTRSIVIQRRMEDLQLGVESYQKKLNLTKSDSYRSNLKRMEAYTAYSNPRGFIYQNKDKKNKLMRIDELHKFSDGTLTDVRTALDDRLKGIQMQYLPQSIWRKSDKDRAAAMIQAIDKRLKTRRIMRHLERFVGGRLYEGDFRMLQRTI
nr:putative non-specific serine/threonine protein kinase [Tanacetum cinerariifolium]